MSTKLVSKSEKSKKIATKKVAVKKSVKASPKVAVAPAAPAQETKEVAPATRAVVKQKDFRVSLLEGKLVLTIPVVLIHDCAVYDDKYFSKLSEKLAAIAENQLKDMIAEYIGFDEMIDVAVL